MDTNSAAGDGEAASACSQHGPPGHVASCSVPLLFAHKLPSLVAENTLLFVLIDMNLIWEELDNAHCCRSSTPNCLTRPPWCPRISRAKNLREEEMSRVVDDTTDSRDAACSFCSRQRVPQHHPSTKTSPVALPQRTSLEDMFGVTRVAGAFLNLKCRTCTSF
eukprot:3386105-Amphidinium_carterae.1